MGNGRQGTPADCASCYFHNARECHFLAVTGRTAASRSASSLSIHECNEAILPNLARTTALLPIIHANNDLKQ